MKQTDQGGNKIPDDLVVLPEIGFLEREEIAIITTADWYDVKIDQGDDEDQPITYLMASAKAIDYFSDIDLNELGGIPIEALKVDDRLKRWSVEDGFYHS